MILKNKIIPAILAQNKQEFEQKITKIKNFGFKFVQIDISDGFFVKNKTFYNLENNLDYELHLMLKNPERFIEQIKDNKNIKRIIFHFEAVPDNVSSILKQIKHYGFEAGLAINPKTPVIKIKNYLKNLDLVLLMSVQPGFSGQKFIPETLNKIKNLRQLNSKVLIEVDGGVNKKNAEQIIKAGADFLAIGSGLDEISSIFRDIQ